MITANSTYHREELHADDIQQPFTETSSDESFTVNTSIHDADQSPSTSNQSQESSSDEIIPYYGSDEDAQQHSRRPIRKNKYCQS